MERGIALSREKDADQASRKLVAGLVGLVGLLPLPAPCKDIEM
jgi:hypothetical protein